MTNTEDIKISINERREEILRLTRQRIRAYNAGDSEDYLKLSMKIDMRVKELVNLKKVLKG